MTDNTDAPERPEERSKWGKRAKGLTPNREQYLRGIEKTIQKARKIEEILRGTTIRRSDEGGFVTASVDGLGHLIEINVTQKGLTHLTILGDRIAKSIMTARRASSVMRERLREKHLPGVGSEEAVAKAFANDIGPADLDLLDFQGTAEDRNMIAECIEGFNQITRARESFERKRIEREVGANLGTVNMNITKTNLRISLHGNTHNQIDAERLSRIVTTAVHETEALADKLRQGHLNEIYKRSLFVSERISAKIK